VFHLAYRPLYVLALLLAVAASAQQPAPSNQKVTRDPTEYNAYMSALHTQDAASRAAAMEAFARQYPHSVVYLDALEQEMAAWQQTGNVANVKQAAKQILVADSGNVRVLAVLVALDRFSAMRGDKPSLDELCLYSTGGMREVPQWQKPGDMTDADFAQLSRQMEDIFNGAAGFCALQQKNYSQARDFYSRAYAIDPTNLQDVDQLAVADLEMTPLDANGFWYCIRGISLAAKTNDPTAPGAMQSYCKLRYMRYHGSLEGWNALFASSATQNALPKNFAASIKPAPSTQSAK
jgi:tetratricopeptide (TPR) repeat protein